MNQARTMENLEVFIDTVEASLVTLSSS
jgi:hypothetical protein